MIEWATIRLLTNRREWTKPEQQGNAATPTARSRSSSRRGDRRGRRRLRRLCGNQPRRHREGKRHPRHVLVQLLLKSEIAQVPAIVLEMKNYRRWAVSELESNRH